MYILKISIWSGPMSDERLNIQIWYQTRFYRPVVLAHEQRDFEPQICQLICIIQICGSDRGTIKIWSGPNSANEGFWYHFREWLTGCASSFRCAYRLVSRRSRVDPHARHILSWKFGHEKISTFIIPLPLIQEGHLSVIGERMCTKYW